MRLYRASLVLTLLAAAAPAAAQSRCNQPVPSEFRRIVNALGQEVIYIGGPTRFVCSDGVEIEADSAIWTQAASTLELLGDVFYQDSTSTLTSDWANYLGRSGQVFARGNVVLTDLGTGSVVTGEQLDHQRETPDRPAPRSIISGGRPHALLHRRSDPVPPGSEVEPADSSAGSPIEVDADWMRIDGGRTLTARGDVVLDRAGTVSSAEEMVFDQEDEHLRLERNARVVDESFELSGRTIEGWLVEDRLREVRAESDARLMGDEIDVDAPLIHLELVDGELHRMQAWRPGVRAPRPDPATEAVADEQGEAPEPPTPPADSARVARSDEGPPGMPIAEEAGALDGTPITEEATGLADRVRVAQAGAEQAGVTVGEEADGAALLEEPAAGVAAAQDGAAAEEAAAEEAAAEEAGIATAPALEGAQPVAVARGLRLVADSIDALAPGRELERVVAVGEAYGEQVDTARVAWELPELISRDWIRGDTITGFFGYPADDAGVTAQTPQELARVATLADDPTAAAGDTTRQRVLERLVVVGASTPARSLYRLERTGTDDPSINYLVASRIVLHLRDGEVTEVEAEGPVDGLFLDRAPVTPDPSDPEGTTVPPVGGGLP